MRCFATIKKMFKFAVVKIFYLIKLIIMKIVTVGRRPENTVIINDPFVSGQHCEFVQEDNGTIWVIDHSKNGTFVNGYRCQGRMQITPGSVVTIGNMTLPWQSYFPDSNGSQGNYNATYVAPQGMPQMQQPMYQPGAPQINIIQQGGNQSMNSSSAQQQHHTEYKQHVEERPYQYVTQQEEESHGNGIGIASFILALIGIAPLAFIFSLFGLGRRPKGFAVAGFLISLIEMIVVASLFMS